jgi:thiosulfate sulfurtransferase
MNDYKRIDAATALALVGEGAPLFDIRDPQSFAAGHHPFAVRLDNGNAEAELGPLDRTKPVLVCCYHGNSSRMAAASLAAQGFLEACSIDGGWDALEEVMTREG